MRNENFLEEDSIMKLRGRPRVLRPEKPPILSKIGGLLRL